MDQQQGDSEVRPSYALLADGSTVEIRAAGPGDTDDVRQMHEQMSPGNSYFRFFSFSPQAPEREAQRLTRPASPDHLALLARLGGKLIGVASYEATGRPGTAEIAFAVSDEMHGRGVATLAARAPGVDRAAAAADRVRRRDAARQRRHAARVR